MTITATGGVCECGHAKADHLRGVGCCNASESAEEDCGCGVFTADDDMAPPNEWGVEITTADGRGTFRVRAAPDASLELRAALYDIAEAAYQRLEALARRREADAQAEEAEIRGASHEAERRSASQGKGNGP